MASSFEKSVKGATKIKAAPPKTKYIEHILIATHAGEAGVGEVFRALQHRLRDSTWTVVLKSLITVHLMIREGSPDVTLAYLAKHRNMLAISMFSDAQTQGRNIRHYSNYLSERARAFRDTKSDWVRTKEARLENLPVEKGLLRETEIVQGQLTALLKCKVMDNEPENEVTITVFRLLVLDLLALFQVLNQALINVLGHFFEMSKVDAERALEIYRTFSRQTDFVVQYLSVARQYEHHTRVEVPKLKHAPVNLGRQLEEYLKDPDFEVHRRQYLAELAAKKSKGGGAAGGGSSSKALSTNSANKAGATTASTRAASNGVAQSRQPAAEKKVADVNLIDFFDSIEQHQATPAVQSTPSVRAGPTSWVAATGMGPIMGSNPQFAQPIGQYSGGNGFVGQPTGFQTTNPFQQQSVGAFTPQQQQHAFGGAPYGGFAQQTHFQPSSLSPIPQESVATFPASNASTLSALNLQTAPQTTNPFRQSVMMNPTGAGPDPMHSVSVSGPHQSTNPFARSASLQGPFQLQQPAASAALAAQPLQPMATGTNPFARTGVAAAVPRPATSSGALAPQPTGSTNPFRQGAFVNHSTGMGWQHNQQPIGGGLDQLESIQVFPRPTATSPWQS